jgi:hypothetical protein
MSQNQKIRIGKPLAGDLPETGQIGLQLPMLPMAEIVRLDLRDLCAVVALARAVAEKAAAEVGVKLAVLLLAATKAVVESLPRRLKAAMPRETPRAPRAKALTKAKAGVGIPDSCCHIFLASVGLFQHLSTVALAFSHVCSGPGWLMLMDSSLRRAHQAPAGGMPHDFKTGRGCSTQALDCLGCLLAAFLTCSSIGMQ